MILRPARLEPVFTPRPWGSHSLGPFFPDRHPLSDPIGEVWMTGNESRFANGPFAGEKLGVCWPQMPTAWKGGAVERRREFPLLVKFIFPEDKLSLQVHPDDEYAAKHEQLAGGLGKTEMWYAVRARPGAEVRVGLKRDVSFEQLKSAITNGSAEDCLVRVPLCEGEAVFVPAGTAHGIGAGLVLCEIQQQSDLTYRLYDYNRRDAQGRTRELHIEKALDVIRVGEQVPGKIDPVRMERSGLTKFYLAVCTYFATEKWELSERVAAASSPEHFDLLIFLEGQGSMMWGEGREEYLPGQLWMIPAALGDYSVEPGTRTSLLRTYVPSDKNEFTKLLAAQGVPESNWSRLVHA